MKLLSLNDNSDNFYFMFNTLKNIKYVPQSHERHWISKFSSFEIYKPSQEEQQKIGAFFKQLDETIALHQRKLDLLKEQKKGYLQKMFPKNGAKVPELRFAGFADDWEEQQKIGAFFKQLDETIALHQRKLDLLKEQKKGYLQKMFPKNGAKVPELRFAGFADDWELRKLGDVVGEIQSGNRLPKDSLTNGDVPYVVAQTKNDGVFTKIARGTLDYNGKPMKLFPGNSISFSIDNPEAMFYRNAEFYTSNIMRVIHEDHLTHEQYVFILENMKRFIRGYDWSRKFSGPVVSNLEYLQPSEEEQQKIGSFFKQLDDTITLHQRKLEKLQELKKGYLQKMFLHQRKLEKLQELKKGYLQKMFC